MKSMIELTTSTEETSWIPVDSYLDLILEAAVCYGQLSGVITAVNHDFTGCQGKIVQVRSVPARTAQALGDTSTSIANCLSATSSTLTTYSITLSTYGDYDTMTGFGLFQSCGNVKAAILNEMAKGLAKKRDIDIYAAIGSTSLGAPGFSQSMASALKCFGGFFPKWYRQSSGSVGVMGSAIGENAINLYDAIVHSVGSMRNAAYNPDTLIINPNIAAFLKINFDNHILDALIKFDSGTGKLTHVAGLDVIECCNAHACHATSAATVAVIIDSSRAVGEAWGMRPKYTETYESECDYYKEVLLMYWGTAHLDKSAICHIVNG